MEFNGKLIITKEHHTHNPQKVTNRVLRALWEGRVLSCDGVYIPVKVDTVCIHSDTPNATELAQHLNEAIKTFNNCLD